MTYRRAANVKSVLRGKLRKVLTKRSVARHLRKSCESEKIENKILPGLRPPGNLIFPEHK